MQQNGLISWWSANRKWFAQKKSVSPSLPLVVCLLHSCLLKENLFHLGKTIFPCKYPNTKLQFTTSTTTNDRTELHEGNWKISYWDNSKESFDFFFFENAEKTSFEIQVTAHWSVFTFVKHKLSFSLFNICRNIWSMKMPTFLRKASGDTIVLETLVYIAG